MKTKMNKGRRQLLVWTTPVVATVVLPAHADMSPLACMAPPIVSVLVAPKCAGAPPIGQASLEIVAPDSIAMELKGIEIVTSDSSNVIDDLPNFPAMISQTVGVSVTWTGPASDAITCLPIADISITIEYCCEDEISLFETYDVTALLIASLP